MTSDKNGLTALMLLHLALCTPAQGQEVTGTESTGASLSATVVVPKPGGVVDDGTLIAAVASNANDSTPANITAPSGFTLRWDFAEGGVDSHQAQLLYTKEADGTDADVGTTSYTWTHHTTRRWRVTMLHIDGGDYESIVTTDNSGAPDFATNATPLTSPVTAEVQSITTPADDSLVLYIVSGNEDSLGDITMTAPAGFTEIADDNSSGSRSHIGIASDIQETAGATGTVAGTLTSASSADIEGWIGGLLAISPADETPSPPGNPANTLPKLKMKGVRMGP